MSETQRAGMTPGPWEWVVYPGDRGRVKGKPLYRHLWNRKARLAVLDADYLEFNGEGVWETWIRVSEANAKAIAALPELIETLRGLVACHDYRGIATHEMRAAKAALTKAGVGGAE